MIYSIVVLLVFMACKKDNTHTPRPDTNQDSLISPDTADYYVAKSGSDENSGTYSQPFLTINKAVETMQGGEVVFVRSGIYNETLVMDRDISGTTEKYTVIKAYPGDDVLITQNDEGPGLWGPIVLIKGSYILIEGFEISHSTGRGVQVWTGSHNNHDVVLRGLNIHHTVNAGIFMEYCNNFTVEECVVWQTNRINDLSGPYYDPGSWSGAITPRRANNIIIRKSKIYESYGEGINIHGGVDGAIIEDNILWDTYAPAIYPINSRNVLVQRNLLYHTNDERFRRNGNPGRGIMMGDEHYFMQEHGMTLENITVINNFIAGFQTNIGFWFNGFHDVSALKNVCIANNTLVNAHSNEPGSLSYSIWFQSTDGGSHAAEIKNNIIYQTDESSGLVDVGTYDGELVFDNNLWSAMPQDENANGANDIIADPMLELAGSLIPGALTPEFFTLKSASPAINNALRIDIVVDDYFGAIRGHSPDIGAHEK